MKFTVVLEPEADGGYPVVAIREMLRCAQHDVSWDVTLSEAKGLTTANDTLCPASPLCHTGLAMLDHLRHAVASYRAHRIERDELPRAAVLIAIYEQDGAAHVLLTLRTETVEHHKGQISFPGGAQDSDDADLVSTALRETEEEIGLRREDVEVWGQLDDIVTVSNFVVSPYVGRVTEPSPYPFAPSAIEVAELLAVPLPHLRDPSSLNLEPAPWRDRLVPPPSYNFGQHLIWGATARMLRQFLELTQPPEGP